MLRPCGLHSSSPMMSSKHLCSSQRAKTLHYSWLPVMNEPKRRATHTTRAISAGTAVSSGQRAALVSLISAVELGHAGRPSANNKMASCHVCIAKSLIGVCYHGGVELIVLHMEVGGGQCLGFQWKRRRCGNFLKCISSRPKLKAQTTR